MASILYRISSSAMLSSLSIFGLQGHRSSGSVDCCRPIERQIRSPPRYTFAFSFSIDVELLIPCAGGSGSRADRAARQVDQAHDLRYGGTGITLGLFAAFTEHKKTCSITCLPRACQYQGRQPRDENEPKRDWSITRARAISSKSGFPNEEARCQRARHG